MRSGKEQKQDPIIFDILSLMSMALYVAFLFNANKFYTKCTDLIQDDRQLIEWIRVEQVIFFSNLAGMCLFLLLKAIMGRLRIKF